MLIRFVVVKRIRFCDNFSRYSFFAVIVNQLIRCLLSGTWLCNNNNNNDNNNNFW